MPTSIRLSLATALLLLPCTASAEPRPVAAHSEHHEDPPEGPALWSPGPLEPQYAIDCTEHKDTGYKDGNPYEITVVHIDGQMVEVQSANAYYQMAQAAANNGVGIAVVSGFRTNAEQLELYNCFINCNCNQCNQAAPPGYSNHQSGHAFDLNTSAPGVYDWLNAHGGDYGFTETVAGEPWHWEWWGGGPPVSGPCGVPDYKASFVAQSFPFAADFAVEIKMGETHAAWIDLKNEGKATWTANTKLATTPRDQESPLYAPDWLSPTRLTGPDADTPPGQIGRFSFTLGASAPYGEYNQTFALVEEGITWFSDAGGPADNLLAIRVDIVETETPPVGTSVDPPEPETSAGTATTGEPAPTTGTPDPEDMSSGTPETTGDPDLIGPPQTGDTDTGCGCRNTAPAGPATLTLVALLALRRRRTSPP